MLAAEYLGDVKKIGTTFLEKQGWFSEEEVNRDKAWMYTVLTGGAGRYSVPTVVRINILNPRTRSKWNREKKPGIANT